MPARTSHIPVGVKLAVGALLCLALPSRAETPWLSREVYYQVTFADGSVRDLNEVPKAKKGIRRVLRVSRYEQATRNYEMLSTGRRKLTVVGPGKTVRNDLTWNGKAWVAQSNMARRRRAGRQSRLPELLDQETNKARRILKALGAELSKSDLALAEAERQGSASAVAKATQDRQDLLESIKLYQLQLKALEAAKPPKPATTQPSQAISPGQNGPESDQSMMGLNGEIRDAGTLPHKVQVWKLPPGEGLRAYSISMAHPEAGPFGAFHYVAYADTSGDGLPDALIDRSPLVSSTEAGGWTRWEFTTDQEVVFVGNAWTHPDTTVYYSQPDAEYVRPHWGGLSDEAYVSDFFGGVPRSRYPYDPYLTNLHVWVDNRSGRGHHRRRR